MSGLFQTVSPKHLRELTMTPNHGGSISETACASDLPYDSTHHKPYAGPH